MSLWGIRLENMSDKNNCLKRKKELGDGDDEKSNIAEKLQENIGNFEGICKNETCQTSFAQIMSVGQQMRKKYYEDATTESPKFDGHCAGDGNTFTQIKNESAPPKKNTPESLNEEKEIKKRGKNANRNYIISEMFRDLVENGCAISQEESENLQNLFSRVNAEACSNDAVSEISSEIVINTLNESKENVSPPSTIGEMKTKQNKDKVENDYKEEKQKKKGDNKNGGDDSESNLEEANLRRMFKLKNHIDEKILKKVQNKGKTKKKIALEDKMKILREALPR